MTGFSLTTENSGGVMRVRLTGRLDDDVAALLALWLCPLVLGDGCAVVVDLSEAEEITAPAVDILCTLAELGRERPRRFELVLAGPAAAAPLRIITGGRSGS